MINDYIFFLEPILFGGKWKFAVLKDGENWKPVGYCQPAPEGADPEFAGNFHAEGHATRMEAANCYKQWLLDFRVTYNVPLARDYECMVCFKATRLGAIVNGNEAMALCKKHQKRESVEKIWPAMVEMCEFE